MILHELLAILKCKDDGTLLNSLYDEFRDGRDPNDILTLLHSTDEMIGFGCDICCEIKIIDTDILSQIMDKLKEIIKYNNNEFNRIRAYHALYGFYMDSNDSVGLLALCQELLDDRDEDLRNSALEFINKMTSQSN